MKSKVLIISYNKEIYTNLFHIFRMSFCYIHHIFFASGDKIERLLHTKYSQFPHFPNENDVNLPNVQSDA